MGEIVIKVPGNVKETLEIEKNQQTVKEFLRKLKLIEDVLFLQEHYPEVNNAVEIPNISEEDLIIQGD
ncbi:hypothetical protein SAMN06265339_0987 [Desulfurobacterium pacificum]|jgi:hypothetical protein|uniref:Uncharacterized protein n=1 Tax=Desulfurobacterium pacificum TaxID=240166 RepID=A0ABY1NKE2_9BACT|nr:hypothetical protein [Desulfurobacterium pacificum]SMP11830.1 hypothetical protein SAMN06265339_0987 [Desulfurobacterium pacificum]